MKRKTFMELAVGSLVLVGLAAALVMVLTIANRQNVFVKRYKLFAIFDSVGGLKVGAPVFLSGVEVGTVNSISFTGKGGVRVTLQIQKSYQDRIKEDSMATIGSVGLLGDKSVEVTVGSPDALSLKPGLLLRTQSPISINALLESVTPLRRRLEEVLINLGKITGELADDRQALGKGLLAAADLMDGISKGKGTLGRLVKDDRMYDNLARTVKAAGETAASLKELADRVIPMVEEIRVTVKNVQTTSEKFPEISREASRFLASAGKTLSKLDAIADDVKKSSNEIPGILISVGKTADNLAEASNELPGAARSLRGTMEESERVVEAVKGNWMLKGAFPTDAGPSTVEVDRR